MIELLSQSTLLLLFVVLAVGAPLGKIKIAGVNLGIASVLFTGLAFGSLSPNIKLPAIIYEIGLVLFIYSIGISSGEQFFGNLKKNGLSQYVVADGPGFAKGCELAARIAGNAPLSNFSVVQALPRIADLSQSDGLLVDALMSSTAQGDEAAKERVRAFLEKRAGKVEKKA